MQKQGSTRKLIKKSGQDSGRTALAEAFIYVGFAILPSNEFGLDMPGLKQGFSNRREFAAHIL